jgi:peptidoglycan/LPS O-acetylase OafA/YrhL
VLRGIAILLVLCHHCVIPTAQAGRIAPVVAAVQRFGWSGVDLFFVLSGFLIGGLLFDEERKRGQLDARRFLLRRMLKIWPPYYALLAYVFIFSSFLRHRDGSPATVAHKLVPNLVHLQNYFVSLRVHTWSLAVEEHFYLFLPLVLLLLLRSRRRLQAFPVVAISAIVAVAANRVVAVLSGWTTMPYFATHYRIDGLLFGVLIAYAVRHHPGLTAWAARRRGWLLAVAALLLLPMLIIDKERAFVESIGFTLCYLGYGCMLLAFISGGDWNHALPRAVGFVGLYSYSIYLWFEDLARTPVGVMVSHGLLSRLPVEARWLVAQLAYTVLAVAMGCVMSIVIERPMLKLRDRLFPARAPVAVENPVAAATAAG